MNPNHLNRCWFSAVEKIFSRFSSEAPLIQVCRTCEVMNGVPNVKACGYHSVTFVTDKSLGMMSHVDDLISMATVCETKAENLGDLSSSSTHKFTSHIQLRQSDICQSAKEHYHQVHVVSQSV